MQKLVSLTLRFPTSTAVLSAINSTTANVSTTEKKDYSSLPYFETPNFEGWARQFRTLVDSNHKMAILRNLDELISDAMKVTVLTRALSSLKNSLHMRVADALRVSPQQFNYAQLTEIILGFDRAPPSAAAPPAQPQVFAIGEGDRANPTIAILVLLERKSVIRVDKEVSNWSHLAVHAISVDPEIT